MNKSDRGLSLFELLVVIVILYILAVVILPFPGRSPEAARRASCANNLKQYGLSLKMYAMENEGGHYPPMQVEITPPERINPNHPSPSKWNSFTYTFAPRALAIYPEYMSDVKVTICPSDSSNSLAEKDDLTCIVADNSWDQGSTKSAITDGCMDEAANSYIYLNWVFDKLEQEDPVTMDFPLQLQHSWLAVGPKIDFTPPPSEEPIWFPTQLAATLAAAQNKSFLAFEDAFANTKNGHQRFLAPWDDDLTLDETVIDLFDETIPYGNGSSNTVFHLMEGVERFLITDTNGIESGAMVLSNIAIMLDKPGYVPATFNHIPGGSNVLYLDGHVEFLKYNTEAPINNGVTRTLLPIIDYNFQSKN